MDSKPAEEKFLSLRERLQARVSGIVEQPILKNETDEKFNKEVQLYSEKFAKVLG